MKDDILSEAEKMRQHELKLAKIAADKEVELAKERRLNKRERRPVVAGIIALLCGAVVLSTLILVISRNVHEDRVSKQEIIKECIRAGNIWYNDDCLIARKP